MLTLSLLSTGDSLYPQGMGTCYSSYKFVVHVGGAIRQSGESGQTLEACGFDPVMHLPLRPLDLGHLSSLLDSIT